MERKHQRRHVVILGGGFAGLAAAQELERRRDQDDQFNVTLIDKNCYHLYHALLYEVATAAMDIREDQLEALQRGVCVRIKALNHILLKHDIQVIQGEAVTIDLRHQSITLRDDSPVMFDELIIALGSESNDFGIPGLAHYSTPLKELPDALRIHLQIDGLLHQVMTTKQPAKILVGGGGVSGVEVAGELKHYANALTRKHGLDPKLIQVDIVEAGPKLLLGLDPWVQDTVTQRLTKLGVNFHFRQPIVDVQEHQLRLADGTTLPFDALIWCGGIKGHRVLSTLGVRLNPKGQVMVTPQLFVPGYPNVSVVGDALSMIDPATQKPVPQIAPLAVDQGRLVATNIFRRLHQQPIHDYWPEHPGYAIPVGGAWAVSTIGGIKRQGLSAWLVRKWVDLKYFMTILRPLDAWRVFFMGGEVYLKNQ